MKYGFYLIIILWSNIIFAQTKTEKKLSKKKLIEQADYYFFKENFPKALELYDEILNNYPKNHYVQYHRYVCHQLTVGRGSSLDALREYQLNEGRTDKFYNYWLGRIHHSRYEFEIAEKHFKAFLELDVYKTREITKETENRLNNSQRAYKFYLNPNEFELKTLESPINSPFADLSPAFYDNHNELLFVSSRLEDTTKNDVQNFDIFHTVKNGLSWKTPTQIKSLGKLSNANTKIEVVNNDGKIFLYGQTAIRNTLLFSNTVDNNWVKPKIFDFQLNDIEIESHFFIDDSETHIIFASKGTSNNLDLYQTKYNRSAKIWSAPKLIEGAVNTKYNEDSPFLSHDKKTLYFSSDNPESIGKYDIFKSNWDEETKSWGTPVNIGFPINTIDDEINFQVNQDNISGFLSSDRLHGQGDYDIYYFHKKGKVSFDGIVYNKSNNRPVPNARIDLTPYNYPDEVFRSYTNNIGYFKEEIFEEEEFKVQISVGGSLVLTDKFVTDHADHSKSYKKNFFVEIPETVSKQEDFGNIYDKSTEKTYEELGMLSSKFRTGSKALLRNIYFDIQSAHIKEESKPILLELYELLNETDKLTIEIGGHTDNTGSYQANVQLSLSRAKAVKSYLTKKGVSADRIKTKGYGSSKPIASNDDEMDGRELNRRIEIKVL